MELNHLRHFYEVAKAASFTGASHKLSLSQSSLSKSVGLLEDDQGVQLFNRTKKGVTLTSLGKEVFEKCQILFSTAEEIENICRGKKEVYSGNVKLGASDHIANYILAEKLIELKEKHPEVTCSVFSGTPNEIVKLILDNEIEYGLFFSKIKNPGIVYRPIGSVKMALVCQNYLLKEFKLKPTLSQLKLILQKVGMISSIGSQYLKHPSKAIFDLIGANPKITFESNSQEAQKRLCLEGGGIAFLAHFMVSEELKNKTLVEIELDAPLVFDLYLASKSGNFISPSAELLIKNIEKFL
jgi:DNA-binding transcriptional LysR family regulator